MCERERKEKSKSKTYYWLRHKAPIPSPHFDSGLFKIKSLFHPTSKLTAFLTRNISFSLFITYQREVLSPLCWACLFHETRWVQAGAQVSHEQGKRRRKKKKRKEKKRKWIKRTIDCKWKYCRQRKWKKCEHTSRLKGQELTRCNVKHTMKKKEKIGKSIKKKQERKREDKSSTERGEMERKEKKYWITVTVYC